MAFQEEWQQGIEEGYKLGKGKGYKECSKEYKEEETKKSKNKANKLTTTFQDTQVTPSIIPRVDATPETDLTTLKACTSINMMHIRVTQTPPTFVATTTNNPQLLTQVTQTSRNPTLSIAPTTSSLDWLRFGSRTSRTCTKPAPNPGFRVRCSWRAKPEPHLRFRFGLCPNPHLGFEPRRSVHLGEPISMYIISNSYLPLLLLGIR